MTVQVNNQKNGKTWFSRRIDREAYLG